MGSVGCRFFVGDRIVGLDEVGVWGGIIIDLIFEIIRTRA